MRLPRPLLVLLLVPGLAWAQNVAITVDANQTVRTVDERVFGANSVIWDQQAASTETIALLQAAGLRTVRVPGGSLSDEYHWAKNTTLAYTWTWVSHFGSFARLLTGLNAQAFVTVNYGTGTPQEAAGLVAYLNRPIADAGINPVIGVDSKGTDWKTGDFWAGVRAGSPLATDDGFNFLRIARTAAVGAKYWEIGNENYGSWETDQQAVPHDPFTYANRAKDYITRMKAIDPSIKIGVVVVPGEDEYTNNTSHPATNPRTNQVHNGWTPVLLTTLRQIGVTPDFVAYHRYEQAPGQESDSFLLQSAATWKNDAAALRQRLTDYLGAAGASVEIVVTENNSVYTDPGKQSTSVVNGLFLADSVANVMQTEINALVWWDVRNGTPSSGGQIIGNQSPSLYGWRNYGDYGMISSPTPGAATTYFERYPTYYAMKLLSYFARGGDTVVKATSGSTLLAAYATKRSDGTLALLVLNKDPAQTKTGSFTLTGFTPAASANVHTYGITQDNAAKPGGSGLTDIASTTMDIGGATFTASFSPYSMTVLVLEDGSTPPPLPPPLPHRGDFDGDGKADVLWQNVVTGERSLWLMNGAALAGGAALGTVPAEWTISGRGDFNDDGKSDILWTNTATGDRAMWLMHGGTMLENAFLGTIPVEWKTAGCGDFNGDGKTDIFWSNTTTGDCAVWLMNGGTVTGGGFITTLAPEWQVRAAADINGDFKADIVWSNTATGERSVWLMNGATVADGASLGTIPLDWQISAAADCNGDGYSDIILSNTTTGDRVMWLMAGTSIGVNAFLGTIPVEWQVSAADDYNGDDKADIFWSNTTTGDRAMWLMNGSTVTGGGYLTTVDTNWHVVP